MTLEDVAGVPAPVGVPGRVECLRPAGVTRGHVDRAGGGGAEAGVPVVVAHRVVLGVVPQPGDGVAVEVVHDDAGRAVLDAAAGGRGRVLGLLDEHVHLAVVLRQLLRRVAVVLVRGERLGVAQPLRVVLVRVVRQQRADRPALGDLRVEAVDRRRALLGGEGGAVRVRRVRVGAEVVVERLVLVEDHHDVLDRRRRLVVAVRRRRHPRGDVIPGEGHLGRARARACRGGSRRRAGAKGDRRRDREVRSQPPSPATGYWANAHS